MLSPPTSRPAVARASALGRGRLDERLHVEESDLQLLAVVMDAVDRRALAEQQLDGQRSSDAVRAAEDQHGRIGGDAGSLRSHVGALSCEQLLRGRFAV